MQSLTGNNERKTELSNNAMSLLKNLLERFDLLEHKVRTLKARQSASTSASEAETSTGRNKDANPTPEGNIGDRHCSRPKHSDVSM